MNSLEPKFIFTDRSGQYCCACGNVVMLRTTRPPDNEVAARYMAAVLEYGKQFPQGIGLIVAIDPSARVPTDVERKTITTIMAGIAGVVRGAVEVVEGQGFVAAAMRGALTVINMAVKLGYPIKVASSFAEATALLRRSLGASFDAQIDEACLSRGAEVLRAAALANPVP